MIHTAVLKKEVLEYLSPSQNENFVDCTIGEGGHTEIILSKNGPEGKVLGIDLDPQQIAQSKWLQASYKDRIILVNDSYVNLKEIIERKSFTPVNGILLDLGMSSAQLEGTHKGFSFQIDQGLDMRYNDANYLTAEKIVNEWPEERIEKILQDYGEEKFARKISKNIAKQRKQGRIKTTFQLIKIIKNATPPAYWRGKIHYSTRTFQALRIAVNDELENIKKVLPQAVSALAPGGRLVVISFHSLEDRIIKNFFKDKEKVVKILTKKPIIAERGEAKVNPRSRSAKLRAIIKI